MTGCPQCGSTAILVAHPRQVTADGELIRLDAILLCTECGFDTREPVQAELFHPVFDLQCKRVALFLLRDIPTGDHVTSADIVAPIDTPPFQPYNPLTCRGCGQPIEEFGRNDHGGYFVQTTKRTWVH